MEHTDLPARGGSEDAQGEVAGRRRGTGCDVGSMARPIVFENGLEERRKERRSGS